MFVMEEINFSEENKTFYVNCARPTTTKILSDEKISFFTKQFNEKLQDLKKKSNYRNLRSILLNSYVLLQFIDAEKCGNWKQHLDCIQRMLPFFITSGYLNYAKYVYLYLQDMLKIYKKLNNEEFCKFTEAFYDMPI